METLQARLIRHEGNRLVVYDDATGLPLNKGDTLKGNPTIGVGILLSLPGGITQAESLYLLNNRLASAEALVLSNLPWCVSLPDSARDVLVEMVFQLGIFGTLQFKDMLKALHNGDYAGASQAMLHSKWAQQTPARAQELARLMQGATS